MWYLRSILKVSWTKTETNENALKDAEQEKFSQRNKKKSKIYRPYNEK